MRHDSRAKFYSYYRSLRFSRHFHTFIWQQLEDEIVDDQDPMNLEIHRVLVFQREHIEKLLKQS